MIIELVNSCGCLYSGNIRREDKVGTDQQIRCAGDVNKRIHNHDVLNCTHEEVVGNHLFSGRGLAVTFPGDIIQLHRDLKSDIRAIFDHYERISLEHTKDIVWDVSYQELARYPEHEISVFFFDEQIHAHRSDERWLKTVASMNSKNSFVEVAQKLNVPVPVTLCFDDVSAVKSLADLPIPCYVKAAIGVAGKGIFRCATRQEVKAALQSFPTGTPIQIQEEIPATTFLNMQYRITPQGAERLAASEQILDGFTHLGNRFPARCEPWECVEPLANWMYQQGMKGIFAFDVGVVEEKNGGYRYVPIECNPRFNGASYPTAIACKLNLTHWFAEQLDTRHRCIADIDLTAIEYDSKKRSGVIIVSWGTISAGKIAVLISGDPEETAYYNRELRKRLA